MKPTEDAEAVDTTDAEDAEILLADPDDYHRSQRLREIHKARRNVHTVLNEIDRHTKPKDHDKQIFRLGTAVSLYAQELLPIANQADINTKLPDAVAWDDIEQYTFTLGREVGDEEVIYQHHNLVFQRCNQLLAEIKPLVQEDDADEWEI